MRATPSSSSFSSSSRCENRRDGKREVGTGRQARLLLGKNSASVIMYLTASPLFPLSRTHVPTFFLRFDARCHHRRRATTKRPPPRAELLLHCQPPDSHICMHWRRTVRDCRRCDYNGRSLVSFCVSREREASRPREKGFLYTFFFLRIEQKRRLHRDGILTLSVAVAVRKVPSPETEIKIYQLYRNIYMYILHLSFTPNCMIVSLFFRPICDKFFAKR